MRYYGGIPYIDGRCPVVVYKWKGNAEQCKRPGTRKHRGFCFLHQEGLSRWVVPPDRGWEDYKKMVILDLVRVVEEDAAGMKDILELLRGGNRFSALKILRDRIAECERVIGTCGIMTGGRL